MTSNFKKNLLLSSCVFLASCSGYFISDADDAEAKLNKHIAINDNASDFIRYLKRKGYEKTKQISNSSPPICYGRQFNAFPSGTTWRNICFSNTVSGAVSNLKLYQYGAGL